MRTHSKLALRTAAATIVASCALAISPISPALAASPNHSAKSADSDSNTDDAPKNTLRVATSGFIDSFNPFTSVYLMPTGIIRYLYENLVQNDAKDGSPTSGLAKDWDTSKDGKTWTFNMQKDLKWSDDKPLTSEDVKWTYEQMMNEPAMGTANGSLVSNFESVETPDDTTVVIHLKKAQAENPGTEIPIVPKHVWSKIKNPAKFANDTTDGDLVVSGPYKLTKYKANENILLEANDKFWRGSPKMDKIQYIYYTDADASIQALKAGDVDLVTGLTAEQFKNLENEDNIEAHSGIGRRYTSIALNPGFKTRDGKTFGNGNPALHDKKVRQAIRLGIDAKTLLKRAQGGEGVLASSFVPASYPKWHLSNDNPVVKGFDPDQAKQLLDSAGWKTGSDGIREKDGKKLELELQIDSTDTVEQSSADYLQPWMKDIGIKLDVKSSDSDTISANSEVGKYDMYFSGWSLNPDPNYQLGINTCENLPTETDGSGGTTQDGYCDPEFDKLFNQQRAELNDKKREKIVQKMLAMNYEATPQVSLWYPNSLEAYRSDRVEGFTLQPKKDGIITGQVGYWGFLTVKPVEGAAAGGTSNQTGLYIAAGAVGVIIIGGVIFAVVRRRKSADIE
jgi:peptide/nickel transport system substrate-binding protein